MQLINKRAMTVIEVLLAISLGLLVMTLVYGFWRTVVISDKSFKSTSSFFRQVPLALNTLENDLMQVIPYDFSGSYPEEKAFKLNDQRIEFLARLPDGINRVVYEIGSPDIQAKHTVRIGRGVKEIERIVHSTQVNDQVFLLRGEGLLTDEITQHRKVKAKQIILGPFKRGDLSWKVLVKVDSQLQEKNQWSSEKLPHAIKLNIAVPKKSMKEAPIEAVLLLPQINDE